MTGRYGGGDVTTRNLHPPPPAPAPRAASRARSRRVGAGLLAVAIPVALVLWLPLVTWLRNPCGALAAPVCLEPAAILRSTQYVVGLALAVTGVGAAILLARYAVQERWSKPASRVVQGFVAAVAVWLVLYSVSLPSLIG